MKNTLFCTWRATLSRSHSQLNPWTEARVDTENPERGPLLIISGEHDNIVPWAIAHASYKQHEKNQSVTEIKEIPDRGHSLTIDHGSN
jgi:non-heme chloroperoxidase